MYFTILNIIIELYHNIKIVVNNTTLQLLQYAQQKMLPLIYVKCFTHKLLPTLVTHMLTLLSHEI